MEIIKEIKNYEIANYSELRNMDRPEIDKIYSSWIKAVDEMVNSAYVKEMENKKSLFVVNKANPLLGVINLDSICARVENLRLEDSKIIADIYILDNKNGKKLLKEYENNKTNIILGYMCSCSKGKFRLSLNTIFCTDTRRDISHVMECIFKMYDRETKNKHINDNK